MAEAKKEGEVKKGGGKGKEEEGEEEIVLDFSKVKRFFSGLFKEGEDKEKKKEKKEKREEKKEKEIKVEALHEKPEKKESEEIHLDFGKVRDFISKYGVVLLLLIPIFLSIWFRMYSAYLPATDDWARNSVYNGIRSNIASQIDQQYPNLLETNREILIEKQFQKALKEQKAEIEQQIEGTSAYFKSRMKDESGQTYLLAIDPYLWYGHARNYIENGHFGNAIVDGKSIYTLRSGRRGKEMPSERMLSYLEAQLYKVLRIFNPNISLMFICFIMPVILITLAVIPAFFIARRIAGNLAGLFAGIIVAVQPFLLGRTAAGFADTDPFQIFFPLFIAWLFLEAFEAKTIRKKAVFAGLSGLLVGLYAIAWKGWWYIFDFILVAAGFYLLYCLVIYRKELKKGFLQLIRQPAIKDTLTITGVFLLFSGVSVSLFSRFGEFLSAPLAPLGFMRLKEVAVATLWPNVLTTVAEFNVVPLKGIISTMGGQFLFLIALLGIALTTLKKKHDKADIKYALLLTAWFIGAAYAFTKGMRFAILLVPAFAIAFGTTIGVAYKYASAWLTKGLDINERIAKIAIVALLCLLLISPINAAHATAKNEIPSVNDAWYESLTAIKENSSDAIITSWWDFGHWFVAIAERRVTFDGADQGNRIHWVGKTLLTDSEEEATGILMMLNCDQDYAYKKLYKYTNDVVKSVSIIYDIILKDREEARKVLEKNNLTESQVNDILLSTHCDNLIDQYFIASEDMIGKAGVWAHFGSWDFNKANMYQSVKGKSQEEGIAILEDEFGLSSNEAFTMYHEIQKNKADQWISGWPGYLSGLTSCSETEDLVVCGNGLQFNKTTRDALISTQQGMLHPTSIVYPIKNEAGEDDLFEKKYAMDTVPVSAALIPAGDGFKSILMDPALAYSMFTRMFFYEGRGLRNFELFSHKQQFNGQDIYVYKVNF